MSLPLNVRVWTLYSPTSGFFGARDVVFWWSREEADAYTKLSRRKFGMDDIAPREVWVQIYAFVDESLPLSDQPPLPLVPRKIVL